MGDGRRDLIQKELLSFPGNVEDYSINNWKKALSYFSRPAPLFNSLVAALRVYGMGVVGNNPDINQVIVSFNASESLRFKEWFMEVKEALKPIDIKRTRVIRPLKGVVGIVVKQYREGSTAFIKMSGSHPVWFYRHMGGGGLTKFKSLDVFVKHLQEVSSSKSVFSRALKTS